MLYEVTQQPHEMGDIKASFVRNRIESFKLIKRQQRDNLRLVENVLHLI
jgi:hypothetical protein